MMNQKFHDDYRHALSPGAVERGDILELPARLIHDTIDHPNPDAGRILRLVDEETGVPLIVGFHVTTRAAAASILANGPRAQAVRVGWERREKPPAFWLNCVPFIPYDIEASLPAVEPDQDIEVLPCAISPAMAVSCLALEPSWPFAQFGVPVEAIERFYEPIFSQLLWYLRSEEAMKDICEGVSEVRSFGGLPKLGFASGLTAPWRKAAGGAK